jgi:TATA-box binding protein (TBP) (component of TFIID and TFIIIB)
MDDKNIKFNCKVSDKDRERAVFSVKKKVGNEYIEYGEMMIENHVNVTYFYNGDTGEACVFNLREIVSHMMDYYVEFSMKKFAKINMRCIVGKHNGTIVGGGGSLLIFDSAIIVETGADSHEISEIILYNATQKIRSIPGYGNIMIKNRSCNNIVATGRTHYPLCLHFLEYKLPQYVTYESNIFAGAVFKLSDIKKYLRECNNGHDYDFKYKDTYVNKNNDRIISIINNAIDPRYHHALKRDYHNNDDDNNDITKLKIIPKRLNSQHFGITDDKEENVTFLVFPKGEIICTGNKSEADFIKAYAEIFEFLQICRATPEIMLIEEQLIAKKKSINTRNTSGKRKRLSGNNKKKKKKKNTSK